MLQIFIFKDEALFFRMAFVDFDGEETLKAFRNNSFIDADFIKAYCSNIFGGVGKIQDFVKELS